MQYIFQFQQSLLPDKDWKQQRLSSLNSSKVDLSHIIVESIGHAR